VRRAALLLSLVLSILAENASAQPTDISPSLVRLVGRDTVVSVWMFIRTERDLDEAARLVTDLGGSVRRRSQWLHAVSADLNAQALADLRSGQIVRRVQPVARFRGEPEPSTGPEFSPTRPRAAPRQDSLYGASTMPLRVLNVLPLADRGSRGRGVRIAVLDTGFETQLPAFQGVTVAAEYDFVFDDPVVRNQANDAPGASRHGTQTWSLLAADLPGTMRGVAPGAEYLLAKTEDVRSETRVEEDDFVAALEWAHTLGARVVSASLGYLEFDAGFGYTLDQLNGDVAVTTIAADMAAQLGMVVVAAAGNLGVRGSGFLTTPADGDSTIAVGATDSLGALASFSSRGPTADGRVKPDVTAPGVAVFVVDPTSGTGFSRASGTSFSAPLIAGVAALLLELHPSLTPVEIRNALRASGSNSDAPNFDLGWGTPDATLAATFPRGVALTAPTERLLTSVTPNFSWSVSTVPAFALPLTYRLRITTRRHPTTTVLDTVTTRTDVTLATPLRPAAEVGVQLDVTAANDVVTTQQPREGFVAPLWVELTALNDVAGMTTRDPRPAFTWVSPDVVSPPGPFMYDIQVLRVSDGLPQIDEADLRSTTFTPTTDLEINSPYSWRVTATLGADTATTESAGTFLVVDDGVPTVTLLFQNFPNPFPNRALGAQFTCVWFDLAHRGRVRLDILDLRGHLVRTLLPNPQIGEELEAGRYGRPSPLMTGSCDPDFQWDGTASDGAPVPRGVYLLKLDTPDGIFFKRIVFMGAGG
jgi:subtilisin family serine protease